MALTFASTDMAISIIDIGMDTETVSTTGDELRVDAPRKDGYRVKQQKRTLDNAE